MIAVDTSALMAIVLNESEADACIEALEAKGDLLISAGTVGTPSFANNEVTIPLSGLADNVRLTVRLSGVNGGVTEFPVSLGFLIGDVNSSRAVNASDVSAIKAHLGQTANTSNFWFDLNRSGAVGNEDTSAGKARSGLRLP